MGTISKIKAPNGTTYNIDAIKVNSKTVSSNVPSNAKFTDTTYSAGTNLELDGTKLKHTNSITAGTAGTSSATSGSTISVPYITFDARGHITAKGTHTHTITGFVKNTDSDTATDNVTISKSGESVVNIKTTDWTLTTSSTNGLTENQYLGFDVKGSNGSSLGRGYGMGTTAGSSHAYLKCYNKKTNGTSTSNYLDVITNKDGTLTYDIVDGDNFKTAIGAQQNPITEYWVGYKDWRLYGNVINIRILGVAGGSLGTINDSYGIRPVTTVYNPAIIQKGSKWYKGWIGINTSGVISARAILSGTTATEVTNDSSYTIYGIITYII